MNLVQNIRKSRIRTVAAVLAVAGSALFAAVPTAGATSLREYPHFQCYSYSNGTARLVAEPPKINSGHNYTEWLALVYRWNGSTWALSAKSQVQAQNNEEFSFGELSQQSDVFNVARNSYYEVKYLFKDNTDTIIQSTWATPIMDHYGKYSCWT